MGLEPELVLLHAGVVCRALTQIQTWNDTPAPFRGQAKGPWKWTPLPTHLQRPLSAVIKSVSQADLTCVCTPHSPALCRRNTPLPCMPANRNRPTTAQRPNLPLPLDAGAPGRSFTEAEGNGVSGEVPWTQEALPWGCGSAR